MIHSTLSDDTVLFSGAREGSGGTAGGQGSRAGRTVGSLSAGQMRVYRQQPDAAAKRRYRKLAEQRNAKKEAKRAAEKKAAANARRAATRAANRAAAAAPKRVPRRKKG